MRKHGLEVQRAPEPRTEAAPVPAQAAPKAEAKALAWPTMPPPQPPAQREQPPMEKSSGSGAAKEVSSSSGVVKEESSTSGAVKVEGSPRSGAVKEEPVSAGVTPRGSSQQAAPTVKPQEPPAQEVKTEAVQGPSVAGTSQESPPQNKVVAGTAPVQAEEGKPVTWGFAALCAGLNKSRLAIRRRKLEAKKAAQEQRRKVKKEKLKDSQVIASKGRKEATAGAPSTADPGATAGGTSAAEEKQAKKAKREVKSEGRKRPNLPRLVLRPYNCRVVLKENQNLREVERMARAYARSLVREDRPRHRRRRRRSRPAEPIELAPAIPDKPALVLPAAHPWGSWVCVACDEVNGPQADRCQCGSAFWDSEQWASDLVKQTRKDHEERKRARQRTVLDMALSAARWTCQRCQEQNLLRRWKCYKCSARRKRERDAEDSSESDSERERRIQELHDSVAPRKQRKRGGQRQRLAAKGKGKEKSKGKQKGKGRKKVCRRCRGTHTKPCSRAGRPRQKGVRVKFPMSPGVILSFYRKWRLHLPGKARNKRCHALTGNGLRVAEVCRLLGLLSLVPLALRTEQEAEEVIMTASSYAQRTILELEEVSVEAVRVSGRVLIAAILTVGIVALWFVGRLIANRVMRAGHGNTLPCKLIELKDGEMTWEVKGAKGVHRVWISPSGQPACACRSFLTEGNCGHIEAAKECCKGMGISEKDSKKDQQVAFADQPRAKQRGLAALAALGVDTPASSGPTCFDGMVKKAQRVWSKQQLAAPSTRATGEVGCFSRAKEAVSRTAQPSLPKEESSAGATAPRQEASAGVATPREGRWTDGKIRFLADAATFEACEEAIASLNGQGKIYTRAYSFDQPGMVRVLKEALEKGCRVHLVTDQSQATGKTKAQLQVLKELQSSGARVRLVTGNSVNAAYEGDGRGVKVGGKIKGLHHAKTLLCMGPSGSARLVIGSCNFTTSSKANREAGVVIQCKEGDQLLKDWQQSFDDAFDAGATVEEFEKSLGDGPTSSRSRRSPTVERELAWATRAHDAAIEPSGHPCRGLDLEKMYWAAATQVSLRLRGDCRFRSSSL